jgi:predicted membrane protein
MTKYILFFLAGFIIAFVLMAMLVDVFFWENARIINSNDELKLQKVKLQYKLDKSNKYIGTLTYNYNYNMIRADEKYEEFREEIKRLEENNEY